MLSGSDAVTGKYGVQLLHCTPLVLMYTPWQQMWNQTMTGNSGVELQRCILLMLLYTPWQQVGDWTMADA